MINPILSFIGSGWFWVGLAGINLLTFLAYGLDKARARSGGWRTSEQDLLLLAMIGGTPAAYAACRYFRHKTAKKSFGDRLLAVALVQSVAAGTLLAFAL